MVDESQLQALKRLDRVWRELEVLVRKCVRENKITGQDEDQYEELIEEARRLYGRVSPFTGSAGMQVFGRTFDAFQHVLGHGSIGAIIGDEFGRGVWGQLWAVGQSVIQQAVGRADEAGKRGQLDPDPTVVRRYRHLIGALETARAGFAAPVRVTSHVVARIEKSTPFRLAAIVLVLAGVATLLKAFGVY